MGKKANDESSIGGLNDLAKMQILKNAKSTYETQAVIIIIIFIASVISVSAVWNSLQGNWLTNRIKLHENQVHWIKYMEGDSIPFNLPEDERRDFFNAKKHFKKHRYTKGICTANLKNLNNSKINNVLRVKVPWFGIDYDVNDIGFISGIIFILLLFTLNYAYSIRSKNLFSVLEIIEKEQDEETQQTLIILARSFQVFSLRVETIESKYAWIRNSQKYLGFIPSFFTYFPLAVLSLILIHDGLTFTIGSQYSLLSAIIGIVSNIGCLIFVFVLTIILRYNRLAVEKFWHENFNKLEEKFNKLEENGSS